MSNDGYHYLASTEEDYAEEYERELARQAREDWKNEMAEDERWTD